MPRSDPETMGSASGSGMTIMHCSESTAVKVGSVQMPCISWPLSLDKGSIVAAVGSVDKRDNSSN